MTFGSPRIGGGLWTDAIMETGLESRYELWINHQDPVTRLPLSTERVSDRFDRFPLWTHTGQIHYIDWDKYRVNLFHERLKDFTSPTFTFEDHRIKHYLARIRQFMPHELMALYLYLLNPNTTARFRSLIQHAPISVPDPISARKWLEKSLIVKGLNMPYSIEKLLAP